MSKLQTLMSHSSPHPLASAWHLADSTLVPVPAQPSNFEVAASDDLPGAATTHWRETSSNYLLPISMHRLLQNSWQIQICVIIFTPTLYNGHFRTFG
ncbi:hypothetical protein BOTCAL_0118g00160 [Botryotinia calthae]|uniref:Uncharacterized protein n=1 Tax=Botryotinia calthae TaxID=38488 RepID=A0A4Y8D733_9HELO|nr:hypothetical protein BOTCAL_0118g00160 [Botryotinia calthae]